MRIQVAEVTEGLGAAGIAGIVSSSVVASSVIGIFIMMPVRKRKRENEINLEENPVEGEKMLVEIINLDKWKEILTDKEFIIFSELNNHEELTQTDLCRITELSKSTVSRAISRLMAKGLVEKKKYGISNFVSLKRTLNN